MAGPNIRAYGIEVDPLRPNREVLSAITGVYVSKDDGQDWRRLNDLPEGEFHTAHFNEDGTVILSGFAGTYIANPFSETCVAAAAATREIGDSAVIAIRLSCGEPPERSGHQPMYLAMAKRYT